MKRLSGILLFNIMLLFTCLSTYAQTVEMTAIRTQLKAHKKELYYPNSVGRFYKQAGYKLVWVAPDTVKTHAWDAMLLLDCVVQYGMSHANYHPKQLLYDQLHLLMSQPENASAGQKAWYDILLTDAILTFINNLHYGRLNPVWLPGKTDKQRLYGFNAGAVLQKALSDKNFKSIVIGVQPKDKAYTSLQYQMHLATGLRTGDCYVTPESDIRLMAVNMERLRWTGKKERIFIQINIPSQMLTFHKDGSDYKFKIVQGISEIGFMQIDREISSFKLADSKIYFSVSGDNNGHIQNATGKELPQISNQPISNGLLVSDREKLVRLLLNSDGNTNSKTANRAIISTQIKNYTLNKAIPIHLTYFTCEMKNGVLIKFKDIYKLDKVLQKGLYDK